MWKDAEEKLKHNRSLTTGAGGGGAAPAIGCGGQQPQQQEAASYAQGGAYGFDRRAITAFVGGECMEVAAAAVASHTRSSDLFEDEAVGLCMQLHQIPLITCRCFYDWGPCDIFKPQASCAADTNASRLCHLPLTVHKIRQLSWYDGWWNLLSAREPNALDAYRRWQREAKAATPKPRHREG